ncbi:MAG TPA: gluconeogenesis factor YvcK family protein [Chloroflexota bacterium]|nr:gluconeogenesis factor YvcK family protein [Chloroflexota bacterium]
MSIPLWLAPGSTIKRWLLIGVIGLLIIVLGIAYLFVDLYRKVHFSGWTTGVVSTVTLQGIPRGLRGALFLALGVGAIWLALRRLNTVIVAVLARSLYGDVPRRRTVIGTVAAQNKLLRGPRIVTIGGGTGMSLLLHGLRAYSRNITAIVTVADDGGSSGRLRRDLSMPPPGDFRQCIAALADVEPLMSELLQYRFKPGSGLEGHSFGNLLIAAMADITGSFERAVAESSRVLAVRGQILPATLEDVTLAAELRDRTTVRGESTLAHGTAPIERVFLIPNRADDAGGPIEANPEAMEALRDADMIIIGPGSLYTSIMPNLLVPGIAAAIYAARAPLKVFVCNVATEPGETDGYTACEFVRAVRRHVGIPLFDQVLINENRRARHPEHWKSQVVLPGDRATLPDGVRLVERDVVDAGNAVRHDAHKLTQVLMDLYEAPRRTASTAESARRPTVAHAAPADSRAGDEGVGAGLA